MTVGEKIHELRKSNHMSQEQLASQITVSRQAISKWELDETVPDTDNILQLSKIFDVSTDYLLNNDYLCDADVPIVKQIEIKIPKRKTKLGIILTVIFGALGVAVILWWICGYFIFWLVSQQFEITVVIVAEIFIQVWLSGPDGGSGEPPFSVVRWVE